MLTVHEHQTLARILKEANALLVVANGFISEKYENDSRQVAAVRRALDALFVLREGMHEQAAAELPEGTEIPRERSYLAPLEGAHAAGGCACRNPSDVLRPNPSSSTRLPANE